jgi:amino acid adenylation domain-containing protein
MKKPSAISRIASQLYDPRNVSRAVEAQKARHRSTRDYEPPVTDLENQIGAIWGRLLAIDKVGRLDNFFDMGGHSLLAAQMLARVRDACGVELPLKAIFDAPVLARFAGVVEQSRHPAELPQRPTPQPRGDTSPLSFAQKRLWFLEQLAPGTATYNVPQRYRAIGELNRDAFQRAIDSIVSRHEALRTTFAQSPSGPVQIIAPNLHIPVRYIDLAGLEEGRDSEALRLLEAEAASPFDLASGPLLRILVVELGGDQYEMLFTTHHIIYDRWSHGVFTAELEVLYRTACEGRSAPMPPLPLQFGDYAIWERLHLEGDVSQRQIAYWKERLAGAPAVVEFPPDRQRAAIEQHRGTIEEGAISDVVVSPLRELCRQEGATLYMGLLAAFQILLSRYSGVDDVVVGSPVANRNLVETEPLIGFFVGTLPLRTDLSGNPTFRELVRRVRETCLGAFANQAVPFERLVEEVQPERDLSHNPIFQVVFALQPPPVHAVELPGLRMERRVIHTGASVFDSAWFAFENEDGILLRVEYSTDLFDRTTVVRTINHFRNLLEEIAVGPDRRLSGLSLLSEEEQRHLLVERNNTEATYSTTYCAHECVERQAEANPQNVAVVCGTSRLTYEDVNRRANRLAHRLKRLGIGPETVVAVAVERSPEFVISVLAVLKAGGAYLPLDPAYPADRLSFMIADAQALAVVTNTKSSANLPAHPATICLDLDWLGATDEPDSNPASLAHSGDLAYVIYTSGSTGRPKGVEITHRGLLNLCFWHQREYAVCPDDRATQIASPAFDASVWEIWPYLTAGAALYIPDEETRNSPADLRRWLVDQKITLTFLPTPLAEAVLSEGASFSWGESGLRALLTGGDRLRSHPPASLPFVVANHYGPTENSVVTTWTRLVPDHEGTPPIGRPIANTQVYVLDANMAPLPVGIPGELYIGGDGLARGYRNHSELTNVAFVKNPFSADPASRLYRTGDRVRYLPDGNLEFLGRLDQQIKIRGFRIELGEIESVLRQHPSVSDCAVQPVSDERGIMRLVAYVVVSKNITGSDVTSLVREWLTDRLPDYMIPVVVVPLDSIPITTNGKVDRRNLPRPDFRLTTVRVAPRTPLEQELASIWSEVLRLHDIGVSDDFFALGGHSLLATQVVSRIRQSILADFPLKVLFEAPTIEGLAARIENARSGAPVELSPIPHVPRNQRIPVSFAQQRLWFLDQLDPDSALYNAPWTVRIKGDLRRDAIAHTLSEIVRRHEVFRTTFDAVDGVPFMVIAPEMELPVAFVDLSEVASEEQEIAVRRLVEEDARLPFNLKAGPVFRVSLLRLNPLEHVLLLSSHHIANDGWSLWRFVEEMGAIYGAYCSGKASPLSDLPIQYADYAVWQRNWMSGDLLEKQLSYWKKHLAGAPDTLELTSDRPRPAVLSYRGSKERSFVPATLANKLHELSRIEGATMYMTLLTAFQALLFRYTGEEDLVIGSPIANRTRSDIEGVIGFFVNTIVMRTRLSGDMTFRTVLRQVRDNALDAFANQDVPFEKLVDALRPDRYLGRVPLFQVWFALQNLPRTVLKMPGLELSTMDVHNGTSKFDLGLFAVEKPDGLHCSVEYSTDLFDSATIQRLLAHYHVLLESIADNPDQRIVDLALLPAGEERKVLHEWNDSSSAFRRDTCIHTLFEAQVQSTPDNIALVFEDTRLTYAELNRKANQLAHRLRAHGVHEEVLVGICMERSLDMIVGILAILKAGGGYVPLDPAYPKDRIGFMLADSNVELLITQSDLLPDLPGHNTTTICLDKEWPSLASEPGTNLIDATRPENVIYVIYTSGSTGKPKGCVLTHANVARLFSATDQWFNFGPDDTWTLFHSIAFDFSVWEIWGALLYGGKLVIVPRMIARSPKQFHELLVRLRVTVLNQTPSAFQHLILADEQSESSEALSLRYVVFGGEALDFRSLRPWRERHGNKPELINMYGITETTVHVTYYNVTASPVAEDQASIIGRPIPDLQVYILDSERRPVPIGVIGEMFVGGPGVARGYLNRPELTSARFIPDPFNPLSRLYRTGDLARFLPDGNLQYMGRCDHQVKIRGFRIELGEIESVLNEHPGVCQSVVAAREDEPGDKRLIAYVVPDPAYDSAEQSDSQGALTAEQVSQWAVTFDEAYRHGADPADATFNIVGWNSSYTGRPIPAAEMRVWVDQTVDRILALQPGRLLEIGCGTGLLAFRVAPRCAYYHGTDISKTALTFLQQQLQRPELALPSITLEQRAAHEFDRNAKFDTVVINSVAQYFPSLDYFMEVVKGAVRAVEPEGSVFIGDLRSYSLLEMFHTSVQMFQATDSDSRTQTWRRVEKKMGQESELVIAPEVFHALRRQLPQIAGIEIQLKRGQVHNELTRFRYDVVLRVSQSTQPAVPCPWLDWRKDGFSVGLVRETLAKTEPALLGLKGVPNARLHDDVAAKSLLSSEDGPATVGEVRKTLSYAASSGVAVDPEELWQLEREFPYTIEIRESLAGAEGCFDLLVRRKTAAGDRQYEPVRFPGESEAFQPLSAYANNPMRQKLGARLIPHLRTWIASSLPEYMVPSAFVLLDALPLSASGKINRRALPSPDHSRRETEEGYVAPRTPTEEAVAAIVADVLRIDRVGVEDNFFQLGGHSLSATQVVARIHRMSLVDLSVRVLFESPTAAGLAAAVDRLLCDRTGLRIPPLARVSQRDSLPLSFAQQRLWFLDQLEPDNPLYSVPRATRMTGILDCSALQCALNAIVRRHEVLRTVYQLAGDNPVQVIVPDLEIPLPVIDLSALPLAAREQEARRVVEEETRRPFGLRSGPVIRALLVKLGPEDHIFFFNIHHIANDGWSMRILMRELAALYTAYIGHSDASLPELPVQYADYAVWQRNWLRGEELDRQVEYWRNKLAGAPPTLRLPTDRPVPAKQAFHGDIHRSLYATNLLEDIREVCRQQATTPFATMLAAFQCLLSYWTGENDIVVGTDVAGRTDIGTESLIGFFVNLLVLRTDLSGDPSFAEVLSRVRETTLAAYAHQHVPFDKLVAELQPERTLTHNPLVQVLFVQIDTLAGAISMPGIEFAPYNLPVSSKFDLAVFVGETPKGLVCNWVYKTDLFESGTISRIAELFQLVMKKTASDTEIRMSVLTRELRALEQQDFQEASRQKLKATKRKAVNEVV